FDQMIKNFETRVEKGIVPPKYVFAKVVDDCRSIAKGAPFENVSYKSSLLEDFTNKVNVLSINGNQKTELIKEAEAAIEDSLKPAYDKIIIYLTNVERIATEDDGAWKFPQGAEFYQHAIKQSTTTNMT